MTADEQTRQAYERAAELLTATYHHLPEHELEALIAEMDVEQLRATMHPLLGLASSALMGTEILTRAQRGAALERLLTLARAQLDE